jgi:hypothetical protein
MKFLRFLADALLGALALIALALAILWTSGRWCARAEPPPGADGSLAPFYHSLVQPGTGYICCSMSDCRPVVTTHDHGKLYAFVGSEFKDPPNNWVEVPENVVIHGVANQAGEPILCWYGGVMRCFLDGGSS